MKTKVTMKMTMMAMLLMKMIDDKSNDEEEEAAEDVVPYHCTHIYRVASEPQRDQHSRQKEEGTARKTEKIRTDANRPPYLTAFLYTTARHYWIGIGSMDMYLKMAMATKHRADTFVESGIYFFSFCFFFWL